MNNIEKARRMFFDYACRMSFMYQDGVLEKYKQFGVSESQETEWRREYISFWVSRLSVDDLTAVDKLRDAEASEALPDLIRLTGSGDSYTKLWYANAIWYLVNRALTPAAIRERAIQTSVNLWRSLTQEPIQLSDSHKAKIHSHLRALGASTPEEYVVNYAKRKLAEAKVPEKSQG